MDMNLKTLLRGLDDSLDAERQQKAMNLFRAALNREQTGRLPLVVNYPYPHSGPVKPFPHREIFDNPEKMLFNELVHAFNTSIYLHNEINDDLPYTVRANFGTVIIASMFGATVEQRDDNPPWVRHFKTLDEFTSIFDCDPIDFSQGICRQVTERYQFFRDVMAGYPNLQQCVKIVLPDLQGPLDSLELLRGSALYEDFIMEPEMVENGLQLMARAQSGFAKHLRQFVTDGPEGYSHQHAAMIPGNILIRNDSAIMISPEMYAGQVAHHDEYVLREMGGGGVHSCGRIDFNLPEIFRMPSLQCFDFGQSEMNNTEMAYILATVRKITLIRIRVTREELLSDDLLRRFPTGVTLVNDAPSFEDARKTVKLYKEKYGDV